MHYDPDSKQCLPAHRLVKSFDKTFKKLEAALLGEKWKDITNLLIGSDPSTGFAAKFDEALQHHITREILDLPSDIPLPSPKKISPKREMILRALCKAYTQLGQPVKGEQYCSDLLAMNEKENDGDGLVGLAEAALKKEEWEDAVRLLEKAFEASGRQSRDVSNLISFDSANVTKRTHADWFDVGRSTKGYNEPRNCSSNPVKRTTIKY